LNDDDLALAKSFHVERGPEPIEHSLIGGYTLFQKVKLPDGLRDRRPRGLDCNHQSIQIIGRVGGDSRLNPSLN
jgi:hypothetical protein